MTRDLLMIFHPRKIAECIESFEALQIDKAWLVGYTEAELAHVIDALVSETDYDRYVAISDDCCVGQPALDAVLEHRPEDTVITGWCNLDLTEEGMAMSNVTRTPFTAYESKSWQYDWVPMKEIVEGDPLRLTWFAGMCLTSMTKAQWESFPFRLYGGSCCSDFELSWRLQEASVPVYAVRDGGVLHVKEQTAMVDKEPRKQLVWLGRYAHVRMDLM